MLFICAPPRKTPEPEPSVDESAAAVPAPSTTEMCVVPVSLPRAGCPVGVAEGARHLAGRRCRDRVERIENGNDDRPAARRRRARRAHCRPRNGGLERDQRFHAIRLQIVRVFREKLGRCLRARIAHPLEYSAEILGHDTDGIAVHATPTFLAEQDRREDPVQERARFVALDALTSELTRGSHEVGPVMGREAPMGFFEAREKSRHRDGARAHVKDLSACVSEVDYLLFHVPEAGLRDGEEAVEQRRLAARLVHEQEPASRRPGQRTLRDEAVNAAASSASTALPPSRKTRMRPPRQSVGDLLRLLHACADGTAGRCALRGVRDTEAQRPRSGRL